MAEINSVLVTGAWRGIGLEFVKQFLTNPLVRTNTVIATCLSPEEATKLNELKKIHTKLHIFELDVTKFETFESLVNEVRKIVGERGLTLLINNAGIGSPMCTLEAIDVEHYISVLKTNTVGPVMLTKALLPLLRQSALVNAPADNGLGVTRAAVVSISSVFGSIQMTGLDETFKAVRAYGYRESKAALNMATQIMSKELEEDGILVESLDPGFVITDMTAKMQAKITTATSVTGLIQAMLSMKSKNKTGYSSFDGRIFPF